MTNAMRVREKPGGFGVVPFWLLDAGKLAAMTGAEAKVLLGICAHVRGKTWKGRPSQRRLAKVTGLSERTIRSATAHLRALGLIGVQAGGGRGYTKVYEIKRNPEAACLLSGEQTRNGASAFSGKKDGSGAPETRKGCSDKAEGIASAQQTGDRERQQQGPAVDGFRQDEDGRAEVRAFLIQQGIGEPSLSRMVEDESLTVYRARRLAAHAKGKANPPAYIVASWKRGSDGFPDKLGPEVLAEMINTAQIGRIKRTELPHGAYATWNDLGVWIYDGPRKERQLAVVPATEIDPRTFR